MINLTLPDKDMYTDKEAMLLCNIAEAIANGMLFAQNVELSHAIYEDVLIKSGFDEAAYCVAENYLLGSGCKKDVNYAIQLYKCLANDGNAAAHYMLGRIYENDVVEGADNAKKASQYYKRGMELNDSDCAVYYAKCLRHGIGVRKNYKKAYKIFMDVVKHEKDPDSKVYAYLGEFYFFGRGVPRDYKKAAKWYRKGALKDNSICYSQLGIMYAYGLGVEQSDGIAFDYHSAAVELGNEAAKFNLAYCYETGRGVKADMNKAITLYTEAAESGLEEAVERLKELQADIQ